MWKKELPSLGVENVVESLLELDTDFLFVYGTLRRGFALHHHLRRMGVERDGFVALLETAGGKVQPFGQVGYHVREGRKQKAESCKQKGTRAVHNCKSEAVLGSSVFHPAGISVPPAA